MDYLKTSAGLGSGPSTPSGRLSGHTCSNTLAHIWLITWISDTRFCDHGQAVGGCRRRGAAREGKHAARLGHECRCGACKGGWRRHTRQKQRFRPQHALKRTEAGALSTCACPIPQGCRRQAGGMLVGAEDALSTHRAARTACLWPLWLFFVASLSVRAT